MPFQTSTPEGRAVDTAKQQAGSTPLDSLTVAQAVQWVQTNVTDLPSAKVALAHMIKFIGVQQRQIAALQQQVNQLNKRVGG